MVDNSCKDGARSVSKMKKTEIGVIPEDWEVVKLEQVVNFLDNLRRPIKSSERKSGSYPYYGASGVIDYVDSYIFDDELLLLGEDGENILSRNLPLVYYVNEKCWINNHAHVLKCKDIINPFYLLNKLESLDYTNLNSGTAQPKLNKERCRNIQIPLPPLAEQEAIASALSDADAWIESLERLIAKKRLIRQGAMQTLLTPQEDWEVKKLGDCLSYIQPTPYLVKSTEYNPNNDIPVLTAGKTFILGYTDENFGVFEKLPTIIFDDFTTASKYVNFRFKAKSSAMKMLVLKDNSNNLKFLFEIMQVLRFQVGDHKRHWIGEFQNLDIKVPSLSEQTRIATILSDMDAELEALEQKLSKARQIKQGMMQELLTGRTRLV